MSSLFLQAQDPTLSYKETTNTLRGSSTQLCMLSNSQSREHSLMAKVQLIFVPTPGVGHLISTVELAKRLLGPDSPFAITVLTAPHQVPGGNSATQSYIDSVASSGLAIRFEELRPSDPPRINSQQPAAFFSCWMEAQKSNVRDAVLRLLSSSPSPPAAALILDLFCTTMFDVAHELGIPAYIYFTSGLAVLGSILYLPTLHVTVPCEMRDVRGDVHIPGLPPVPPHCMPGTMMDKTDEAYAIMVNHGRRFREAKGLIVNSFAELEPSQLQAIAKGECLPDHPTTPPVFPVGPLLSVDRPNKARPNECEEWLDGQPVGSVVFLCFGSLGAFGAAQVREVAAGLEQSGHRFLWVLRCPSPHGSLAPVEAELGKVLPAGFLERTEGRGMVWPSWAPQMDILAHRAVGGFVTHCGWNSVMESLWFGVPMLGWPLYAEQRMNCLLMARGLGVALELELDYENSRLVSAEKVERGVRSLMGQDSEEGMKVRVKVAEMKTAGRAAVEKGGSSSTALQCLIGELTKNGST